LDGSQSHQDIWSDKQCTDLEKSFHGRNLAFIRPEQDNVVVFPNHRVVMRDDNFVTPDNSRYGCSGGQVDFLDGPADDF
jgi:hypothetical protein